MALPTHSEIKALVKRLSPIFIKEFKLDIPHSKWLEIIAKGFGFKNWNTLNAVAPTAPPDGILELEFNKFLSERNAKIKAMVAEDVMDGHEMLLEIDKDFEAFVKRINAPPPRAAEPGTVGELVQKLMAYNPASHFQIRNEVDGYFGPDMEETTSDWAIEDCTVNGKTGVRIVIPLGATRNQTHLKSRK